MAAAPEPGKLRARLARRLLRALLLAALLGPLLPASPAAAQLSPDEDWRTFETPRFRVTYPARLEGLARRAGARAEVAWDQLATVLPRAPSGGRVDLVLTDHVDFSNGFASVAPRRRIVVYARPPVDAGGLTYFDDWMELVITHELAHVFHLDVTSRFGRVLRGVFGRVPGSWPFYPEIDTPKWVVEGLAVYYETALTSSGRGEGTYHDMVVRTAALEDALETIDRASGQSSEWPGGDRAYVYGSTFFAWLLERHGPEKMADLIEAIAGQWIPYRLNSAAKHAFGVSFSDEWDVWMVETRVRADSVQAALARRAPLTVTEPITRGARYVVSPAISPDGRTLAFVRVDGLTDPQIRIAEPDGSDSRQLARINGPPFFSWAPDGSVIVAQVELDGPYRAPRDLYRIDASGRSTRLTHGARLDHPSVARDGRTALAIQNRDGAIDLVRVDLASGAVTPVLPPEPDVLWAFPSPSPDGRFIAAARWRRGRSFDLVLLGSDGRVVRQLTDDRAVEQSPTWSADGRYLLWISDRSGIPNVYATTVDANGRLGPVHQVTNVATGIAYPSLDPSGRWIYAALYHADGWELERLPFDPERWMDPFPLADVYAPTTPAPLPPPTDAPAHAYDAAETLLPQFWEPLVLEGESVFVPAQSRTVRVVGPFVGFATFATDVIGRHAWQLVAAASTTDAKLRGSLGYSYAGLGSPVLSLFADQSWDGYGPLTGRSASGRVDTLFVRERDRNVRLAATFPLSRFRRSTSLALSAGLAAEDSELLDRNADPTTAYRMDAPHSRLADVRASLGVSTARGHAFSISAEEGAALSLQSRVRRHLSLADSLEARAGADRSFSEGTGRLRLYQPLRALGLRRHVIALRASGGAAGGPGADRFHFDVGGGTTHFFPVRGYANGERAGRLAWSATAEYRFPIVRVNRGWGLIPIHLDQVSGAFFADAGNAWGPELGAALPRYQNPMRTALGSAGAELAADLLTFFTVSFPLRGGVAFPLTAASRGGTSPRWYMSLGSSF